MPFMDTGSSGTSLASLLPIYTIYESFPGRTTYRGITRRFTRTKPVVVGTLERARPDPRGEPGHIRIDTIHQGDLNGEKGVYHINAVDEVTQWEMVASVERISESYLVPALEGMLAVLPWKDSSSEASIRTTGLSL